MILGQFSTISIKIFNDVDFFVFVINNRKPVFVTVTVENDYAQQNFHQNKSNFMKIHNRKL